MPSPNDLPEIPSFKQPKKEDKGGAASATSASGAKPGAAGGPLGGAGSPLGGPGPLGMKVRGLGAAPKSIFERLKQFRKKDLMFIASGLGVLVMAPVAEHFLMSPSQDASQIKPGFGNNAGGFPGDAGAPYEGGTGSMAPGGMVGSGSDVITPLNVRDPSALVMGPGAQQQPPAPAAASVTAPTAPAKADAAGWKDALAAGAQKAASAAAPAAFRAPGSLGGAIRGLSALSGGSYGGGPSYALPPISAGNVPNRGGGSNMPGAKAAADYRGAGMARSSTQAGGAEALRKAADNAGGLFNRAGSAANNLDQASREAVPAGGGAGAGGAQGAGGAGGADKGPGGSSGKDNKALGESLAYLMAKMRMEKELDLEFAKKKWREFEFPKMLAEETTKLFLTNVIGKGIAEPIGGAIGDGVTSIINPSAAPRGAACMVGGGLQKKASSADGKHTFVCTPDRNAIQDIGSEGGGRGIVVQCDPGTCGSFGGAAVGGDKGSGDPGPIQPPGHEDPAGNAKKIENANNDMQQFLAKNCAGGKSSGADPNVRDSTCQALSILQGVYAEHVPNLESDRRAAERAMKDAWNQMDAATKDMTDSLPMMDEAKKSLWAEPAGNNADKLTQKALESWDGHAKPPPPADPYALTEEDAKAIQEKLNAVKATSDQAQGQLDKLNAKKKDELYLAGSGDSSQGGDPKAKGSLNAAKWSSDKGWQDIQSINQALADANDTVNRDLSNSYGQKLVDGQAKNIQPLVDPNRQALTELTGNLENGTNAPQLPVAPGAYQAGSYLKTSADVLVKVQAAGAAMYDDKNGALPLLQTPPADNAKAIGALTVKAGDGQSVYGGIKDKLKLMQDGEPPYEKAFDPAKSAVGAAQQALKNVELPKTMADEMTKQAATGIVGQGIAKPIGADMSASPPPAQ